MILSKFHISELYFDGFCSGLATCLFFHRTFHSRLEPYVSSHRTFHSGLDQMSGLVVQPSRTFWEVAHMMFQVDQKRNEEHGALFVN